MSHVCSLLFCIFSIYTTYCHSFHASIYFNLISVSGLFSVFFNYDVIQLNFSTGLIKVSY